MYYYRFKIRKNTLILEFDQADWIKPWIGFNTKLRFEVKNDFEKIYWWTAFFEKPWWIKETMLILNSFQM